VRGRRDEIGKLEGQISVRDMERSCQIGGSITSHVFLTLEHNESVSAVGLLLLVGLEVRMVVRDHANLLTTVSNVS
jgi:hypothetical protein